ncbi:N-acetylglucosamine kinase [Komagataeibacter nataicola]|uniref:N-acetylglucosamine kinase n=1 Tax=Komagataeibacter nataicola TaxID=265960 RepID=A0A9N7CJ62_9PROT|nr:BadF/BadG/BcrA/BcrD ATPase family protein [Komagataeibacter nataicola]AQU88685.1 N-acetylglucosamine kinase [Komagataeibacter nataicola]PYD66684.1 N-acetylglucosamine kinase [Komagataeibacter nataicola]WEQ57064.1 BadF/BadG/BcrA/BcrD ATPase family protein [Komagataeibacter nataicola]WNM08597.1 BadF/BadG/BcrA/BcrD ATPase family protein [Komagataeibacter nataicola]GBR26142.1 N-acetyl-D-glucosamine kinase [Komagataeibacter nataicola NRIC 0616]
MDDAVLAVDGGGTRTRAVIVGSDGHVLEHRLSGGSNAYDKADWAETLTGLLQRVDRYRLRAATIGLAGYCAERPSSHMQEKVILDALGPDVRIGMCSDVEIACVGAFLGGPGILALAGTGSVIWADDHRHAPLRIGGWGYMLGDEGSGYWIGCMAMRRVVQYIDTRHAPDADFATRLLQALDLPTDPDRAGEALLEWQRVQPHPRSAIAALAHVLDRLANDGSADARSILVDAAQYLSAQVRVARDRLQVVLPWSYGGSVFHSRIVMDQMTQLLGERPHIPQLPPIGGGIIRAAARAGWNMDAAWLNRLDADLAHKY